MVWGPARGAHAAGGPTSPCKAFARIAGCKADAEVGVRLAGDARIHGTVGVHTGYTCFGRVKGCVRRVRTTRRIYGENPSSTMIRRCLSMFPDYSSAFETAAGDSLMTALGQRYGWRTLATIAFSETYRIMYTKRI
ncbi:hypothetical protein BN903_305 [Halorubrum sp. AJ67]|nr:hypothetical protein BN903_305 [Halorubrum sp. AJ67]